MWIRKFGCDVELKVVVVRNDGVTKFNDRTARLLERL